MKRGSHYIADLDYSEDRLTCICGAVMSADGIAWIEHKAAASRPQLHEPPLAGAATPASRPIPVRRGAG